MTFEQAIEVFVHGFALVKSSTHPYVAERVENVWMLRDAPRRRGDYRKEEYVAFGLPAAEVDRIARKNTRGRFFVCIMRRLDEPDQQIRSEMRSLGYRLLSTEPFFIHRLAHIEPIDSPFPIERVLNETQASVLAHATRARRIAADLLS